LIYILSLTVSVYLHSNFWWALQDLSISIWCQSKVRFGCSRSSKVDEFGANRKRVCDFLLVRHSNLGPILHRFGPTARFMCSWPRPYSPVILGVFPLHQIANVGRQRSHGP